MVRALKASQVVVCHEGSLSQRLILCIVKDLTDPNSTCKTQTFNLSDTYTISQFISEVSNRYSYEEDTFLVMWKCGKESINITEFGNRTLGDIGLLDSNSKNIFEIHEKDGPPIRKIRSDIREYICDDEPKIDDICSDISNSNRPVFQSFNSPYQTYFNNKNYFNDAGFDTNNNNFSYETGFVGLINQAMTCYLNSLLQTLFMTPEFRNAIYRWQYKPSTNNEQLISSKKNIPYQLQKLFLQMQTSNKNCLHTQDLTQSFGWGSDDAFQQHDVQELCRVMFDALEKMFKGTEQENLINELYQGKIKDYVKCSECNTESARVDIFLDIQLSIKSYIDEYNYNIYDSVEKALLAYIEPEILDDNNKYNCDKCKKLCKAHKGIIFETFPYILCLQLKRFDFDYKTMMRIKLNNKVTFPEVLDLKPYLDETTLKTNPDVKTEYELFSIMIHSGNATGGHYYAYIKDFHTNQWYNFNDERVTRLDPQDIKKAYGVSYSSFSSTTAYMLLYRQIDPKRNESFIMKDSFPQHLIDLLKREAEELEQAEKLKEYLENLCKIKVILVNTKQIENFKPIATSAVTYYNSNNDDNNNTSANNDEKQCNLHKDLSLEQAKLELAKEFNLIKPDHLIDINYNDYIKKYTRLIKYDIYNDHIEQSFDNETQTVYEALNCMKQTYGYCWLFEVNTNQNIDENSIFINYKPGSITIKLIEINSNTYETNDLFYLRVDNDISVLELIYLINNKINAVEYNDNDDQYIDEIIDSIHLAYERQHTINPYVYLNDHLNKSLYSLNFLKSNKIFIEYIKKSNTNNENSNMSCNDCNLVESNDIDLENKIDEIDDRINKFSKTNFFHTLETITNLIKLTCYLPTNEQCTLYKHKLSRRNALFEQKKIHNSIKYNQYINENLVSYDEVMIARGSTTNKVGSIQNSASSTSLLIPTTSKDDDFDTDKMYSQPQQAYNKRRNAFTCNNPAYEDDDEDECDFGNATNKVFLNKQLRQKENSNEDDGNNTNGMLKRRFSDELSKSVDNIHLKTTKRSDMPDEMSSSSSPPPQLVAETSVPISLDAAVGPSSPSSSSTLNLKDIEIDSVSMHSEQQPQQTLKKNEPQNIQHHHHNHPIDMETSLDEGIGSGSSPTHIKNSPNSLDNLRGSPDTHLNEIDDSDSAVTSTTARYEQHMASNILNVADLNRNNDAIGDNDDNESDVVDNLSTNNDHYGPYTMCDNSSQANQFADLNEDWDRDVELGILNKKHDSNSDIINPNDIEDENNSETIQEKYIKSILITHAELGTRILELTMDKRIDLIGFKKHIKSYMSMNIEEFRVFRVGPNDFESELTRNEHQFQYIPNSSKFLVKLGPTLKYGEYLVPVFKINKNTGFTYLCEFMIEHNINVYDHKALLREDLKDECNEDIPLERMRLRKKTLRHPSTIFLDDQVFGRDVFINTSTELCVEILDGIEIKTDKFQTVIYLRKWNPKEYSLEPIEEIIIDGNSFDSLMLAVSKHSNIDLEYLEVLRCKREYPFNSPILEIHRDTAWRENFLLQNERLEDGYCYYYRDRRQLLGELTEEKKRELAKDSSKNTSSSSFITSSSYFRKETGVKIHI